MADGIRPYVGRKVLEIGAGTGNLTLQLVPRELYWASDINPLYLMYLQRLGQNRPYLRVGYTDGQKGDSYPQEQKFDTVICLYVIEHLADDFGAMRNIREVLEDVGRAVILVAAGPLQCVIRIVAKWSFTKWDQRRVSAPSLLVLATQLQPASKWRKGRALWIVNH